MMVRTNIFLTDEQRAWLIAQPGGMAEAIRRLVDAEMKQQQNAETQAEAEADNGE